MQRGKYNHNFPASRWADSVLVNYLRIQVEKIYGAPVLLLAPHDRRIWGHVHSYFGIIFQLLHGHWLGNRSLRRNIKGSSGQGRHQV